MNAIYLNSEDHGLNFDSFRRKMVEICNTHREENKALAFAFILYDFENPQISKILRDSDYWLALNKISGDYLTVFSIHYKPEDEGIEKTAALESYSFKDNPATATNKLIADYFGNDIKVIYPAILFFQVNQEMVIDSLLVELKEEKIEEAYIELKDNIKICVEELKKVHRENSHNFSEIFDLMERRLNSYENSKKIKRVKKVVGPVAGLAFNLISL